MRAALRRATMAAAACLPAAVHARAGGGSHAAASSGHSGHSHGSSFGGGGGSIGGVIALIIIVLLISYVLRRMRSRPAQSFGAGSPQANAAIATLGQVIGVSNLARIAMDDVGPASGFGRPGPPPAIDAIRGTDQGFELETFLQRAEMVFFLVKRGIQKNDAAAIRPYLNDAMFAAVSQSIAQARTRHLHTLLESLNVRGVGLVDAQCDTLGQRITVHFDLVYRGKTLDDSNRVVNDEGADQAHAEQWTFIRSAAARTAVNGGVVAARCPTCGAELRLNLDGTCAHCKASVTNGSVDWVVSEVRPAAYAGYSGGSREGGSVLGVQAPSIAQGVATLTAADKDFSMALFEGRVKTAFLTLQDAWCQQKLESGRAFLSPGAYFAWSAQLETLVAEGRRNVMENLSVRGIEPLRIVHGRVFDDLTVRISALAADFEIDRDNNIVFGDRSVRPFVEDWTFQRSVGVATSGKPGTLESTCPRCGAPLALTQIGECRYCKAAVTSGKFDWVVSRIDQEDAAAADDAPSDAGGGEALALQVGGAIVGGLLSSFLSNRDDS